MNTLAESKSITSTQPSKNLNGWVSLIYNNDREDDNNVLHGTSAITRVPMIRTFSIFTGNRVDTISLSPLLNIGELVKTANGSELKPFSRKFIKQLQEKDKLFKKMVDTGVIEIIEPDNVTEINSNLLPNFQHFTNWSYLLNKTFSIQMLEFGSKNVIDEVILVAINKRKEQIQKEIEKRLANP